MIDDGLTDDFRALVGRELTALGFTPTVWDGPQLKYHTSDGTEREVGTGNLFKRVKLNDPAESAALVRDFLTNVTSVSSPEWKMPETLEECADRVLPRIGLPFAGAVKAPWSKPLPGADGLVLNLVVDFPTTMAYVTADMMTASATSPGDWLDRALANLTAITKPDWLKPLRSEQGIFACHTTDSYDAARALLLCELTGNDPAGWLVAVPARDWLFARKVETIGVAHFHHLKVLAERAKEEQPYPISDTVYWVRPGKRWQEFRIEIADEKVRVYPPPEFVEVLNALSADGA